MGMLLQRNRKRRTQDVKEVNEVEEVEEVKEVKEVVSDIQSKEVTTSEVEKTDEKPKRKPRTKKA